MCSLRVKFAAGPKAGIAFPGPIWKEGDHWNFIGQGSLFESKDDTFSQWERKDKAGKGVMADLGGGHVSGPSSFGLLRMDE